MSMALLATSFNRTSPWADEEYVTVNGAKFIYKVTREGDILVLPFAEWGIQKIRVGRTVTMKHIYDEKRINIAKPISVSLLASAGFDVKLPRIIRKENQKG